MSKIHVTIQKDGLKDKQEVLCTIWSLKMVGSLYELVFCMSAV